jgi:Tfp pilus assembly protein PilF
MNAAYLGGAMALSKKDNRVGAVVCIFLCAIIWVVFGQTLQHGFANYDDEKYVYKNPHVTPGLTTSGAIWAFTHSHAMNWHPLTWISHMLDCQLYALKPAGHHFTNVLLHAAAAVLLFLVLWQMTAALWRSAFVASVFAVHPLRVESVAWVAERKDVLSGVFFMLTLGAYSYYVRRPSPVRYLIMSILFAFGLMAKPMLVTLPLVLLLLDYWPLQRVIDLSTARKALVEKLPLFVLALGSCWATLIAQRGNIDVLDSVALPWRFGNALVATVIYIWQLIWPRDLAVFYPHPKASLSLSVVALSAVLLATITAGAIKARRTRPYILTGWFWYLIMLVPVIGIVQVGWQGHADRYTYLPHIGLCIAITWTVSEMGATWPRGREILFSAAALIVAALMFQARLQTSYWRDNPSLWRHAIAVTARNATAHNNLGTLLARDGRLAEAIPHFQSALEIDPTIRKANANLAGALFQTGRLDEAVSHYRQELQIDPANADAENNLGNILMEADRVEEALEHCRKFVQLRPGSATGHYNLAVALERTGRLSEATREYERALAIKPDYANARRGLEALRQSADPSAGDSPPNR